MSKICEIFSFKIICGNYITTVFIYYCLTHWQTIHIFHFCLTQGSTVKLTKDANKESSSGDKTATARDVDTGTSKRESTKVKKKVYSRYL